MIARGTIVRFGVLAAVLVVGALVSGTLLWWRAGSAATDATPSPSGAGLPGSSNTPLVEAASPSPGSPVELAMPPGLLHEVPLPAGAELRFGNLAADGEWLVANLFFEGQPNGHQDQLYALNLSTGASKRLADHHGDASVAGSRVAWLDTTCVWPTESSVGGSSAVCSAWEIRLTDLAAGSDRIVASGAITEAVNTPLAVLGGGEDVLPRLALSADTLAYSTGDLTHGFVLHLVTLSSGEERTVRPSAMIEEMRWAGSDLAWIECTDLRTDGLEAGHGQARYYTGTRLMLLPAGATAARQVATDPFSLEAEPGRLMWDDSDMSGYGNEVWVAGRPEWQPARPPTGASVSSAGVSAGWMAWFDYKLSNRRMMVLRPQDAAPRAIADGIGLSGGWIFISRPDEGTLRQTTLEAVRIADLT
jgi:hypothetical protein